MAQPLSPAAKFVESLPLSMPGPEVVSRAAKAGHKLTLKQAQQIRYRAKRRNGGKAPRQTKAPPPPPSRPLSDDETEFMSLVLGIGYNRAASLLAQFRVDYFDTLKRRK
jgi:hypothetical protein